MAQGIVIITASVTYGDELGWEKSSSGGGAAKSFQSSERAGRMKEL